VGKAKGFCGKKPGGRDRGILFARDEKSKKKNENEPVIGLKGLEL